MAEQMINCFGSCLDNLTDEEFYQIHHNVHATLTHQKGNQLFEKYLQRKQLVDSLKCLDMYNITLRILRNSSEESLESLIAQVVEVQEMGEDMNEIHQDLERQIEEALRQRYRIMLIEVLENIKQECQDRLNDKHEEKFEERYIMTINRIRDTIRKLEESLKYSRDLEAARFLRYSDLKTRDKILMDDLRKIKTQNKQMLNKSFLDLFRQSVTDVQLCSLDILPKTLRRKVQKTWHQKYDALLSQNEQLKKKIIVIDCAMKQKQKEIDILQQKLLIAGSVINSKKNTENICRRCWILTYKA